LHDVFSGLALNLDAIDGPCQAFSLSDQATVNPAP
jgi:hypothetical protein